LKNEQTIFKIYWIEFDSMINLRPSFGNRSREVGDREIQAIIKNIVTALVEK